MLLIAKVATAIAGAALVALVVMTNVAVVLRYGFEAPLQWSEEMSGLLMIWIVMIGAVIAERDRNHLTIPMLTDIMPRKLRLTTELAVIGLSVAVLAYTGYLGWRLAEKAQYKVTEILKVSWYWIDIAVPVGAVGIALFMLRNAVADIRALVKGDAA